VLSCYKSTFVEILPKEAVYPGYNTGGSWGSHCTNTGFESKKMISLGTSKGIIHSQMG